MDNNLFNILIAILTLVISLGGGYLITLIKQNFDLAKLNNYYNIAKEVVMSIEQLSPKLDNTLKKEKSIELILSITKNKITKEQADILIEAAVYEVKKLLTNLK